MAGYKGALERARPAALEAFAPEPALSLPEPRDPAALAALFHARARAVGDCARQRGCLAEFCAELARVGRAPLLPALGALDLPALADDLLLSTLDPAFICAVAECVRAAAAADPALLAAFRRNHDLQFHLLDAIDSIGSDVVGALAPLFCALAVEWDRDFFDVAVRVLFDREYGRADVYVGFAQIFERLAALAPSLRAAKAFVPVFALLLDRRIWPFTLDGLLNLTPIESGMIVQQFMRPPDGGPGASVYAFVSARLPEIPGPFLASALRIVHFCIELEIGIMPAIGNDLDLGFLLSIADQESLCVAVAIVASGMRSQEMRTRVVQGGFLLPLLVVLQERPFPARMNASITFCQVLNDLSKDELAILGDAGLFDMLMDFLESDDPLFVRQLLLGFLRLVRISEVATAFVAERWELLEPLLGSEDSAISSYALLLKCQVFPPDL
jgi:hypothetical protein